MFKKLGVLTFLLDPSLDYTENVEYFVKAECRIFYKNLLGASGRSI